MAWKHLVVDEFFDSDDFDFLLAKIKTLQVEENSITNFMHKGESKQNELLSEEEVERFIDKYKPKALQILRSLEPKKEDLVDYVQFTISATPPKVSYRTHEDAHEKVLSGVIYLQPEQSFGTFLHKGEFDYDPLETSWRPNRALFFSRQEGVTWHSYKGSDTGIRFTCVFNLMTNSPKKHLRLQVGWLRYVLIALRAKMRSS